jgi:hypothetical protein
MEAVRAMMLAADVVISLERDNPPADRAFGNHDSGGLMGDATVLLAIASRPSASLDATGTSTGPRRDVCPRCSLGHSVHPLERGAVRA